MQITGTKIVLATLLAMVPAVPLAAQAAPSNVAVTGGKGTATVTWTGIRDETVHYRVLRAIDQKSKGEDLTRPLAFNVTSFIDAAASAPSYFYQVVAVYPDGSEGASAAVQFPAPKAAVDPIATNPRQRLLTAPLTMAPPMALRAPAITMSGLYNRVTVSWRPVSTNIEPVTYEVRRVLVDPTTPGVPLGYIAGLPVLQPDGSFAAIDRSADLHLPTWYRVTAKNASQGSADSPWYRRDPPPHTGVDTIIGGYFRIAGGKGAYWVGCIRHSRAPGADTYWMKVKTASGIWVNLPVLQSTGQASATQGHSFDTQIPPMQQWNTYLENGGLLVEVQVGGMFAAGGGVYLTDVNHLQPMYVSFAKSAVPLTFATCQP